MNQVEAIPGIDLSGKRIPERYRNLSNTLAFLSKYPNLLNQVLKYSAEK